MIELRSLTLRQGRFTINNVSLSVPTGRYAVLMGRTGSGKTTIVEAICGLRTIASGHVILDGRDVTGLKPGDRGIGYVPQDAALFPTLTVRENLGFAAQVRRWPSARIQTRVNELADLLGITPLLDRRPAGLSGGETQRIALGRALAAEPAVLCLDEPLSSLDHDTREEICGLLQSVQRHTGVTTLHVTHSPTEADRLADLLFRLDQGAIKLVRNGR